jgi:DNA-binding transcriptional LysR family regulator
MDFKQIEAFVNVAKYKSFSKAAEAIYLSQPTISSHIASLENELGVILFDRNGKEVRLTRAGSIFIEYAVNLINIRNTAI